MCVREKTAKEKAKISLCLAAFLALCVPLGSCEINSCSQDLLNIQCRGRCAAAASTKVRLDSVTERISYSLLVSTASFCIGLYITICLSSDLCSQSRFLIVLNVAAPAVERVQWYDRVLHVIYSG